MAERPAERPAAGHVSLQDVLRGRTDGTTRTDSNMIRVFISSTFTDMSSERKVLMETAFPQLQSFCRSLGLLFEVVDLCWGLRNVPFGDHEACEVALQEIRTCQRVSAGPAFIALLGNRYGHRALPRLIPEKQFEALRSKLSRNPEGVQQLQRWFLKDDNAVPPTYVLQPIRAHFPHYSDLRPQVRQQHDSDVLSWRLTEGQLLRLLRSAATDADITAEQRRHFYISVTEQEVRQGLSGGRQESSALLFVRDAPQQKKRDGPRRLARFADVTADGLQDAEARELLAALKSQLSVTSQKILHLHSVELSRGGGVDPKRREHAQYLDGLCQQLVTQMKSRISAGLELAGGGRRRGVWGGLGEQEGVSGWMVEEMKQHLTLSGDLPGREGLLGKICLAMWEASNGRHGPVVVHGAAGMGKTALLCKVAQEIQGVMEGRAALVIRLLASRHPQRPDVDHVLRSVCLQVSLACGLAPPPRLMTRPHLELLQVFRDVLEAASQQGGPLLVVLDSLEQLADRHHAQKLRWLPADVPPNVHLLVSMETSSEAFASMRLKAGGAESFFEAERLSPEDSERIVESYLRASGRTLTGEQRDAVLRSVRPTGSPLHLNLTLAAARRWTSSAPPAPLGTSTQEVMSQLLLRLEEKHGRELVGGALGYIALARDGLLEAELRDVMSLDDDIISEVYRYSLPPTPSLIRLPPLLWARLKLDLEDQLEERWTCGVATISFKSRRLSEAVIVRYVTSERRGRSHRIMAEYFLGRWSGKLKPASLPDLSLLLSDRKVPPQPLWFSPGLANVRKLQELPYHLLHAGLWEELRQEVISSPDWMFCKIRVCGVSSVIQDLDQCSQYMDCAETGLIRDTLVLIRPGLDGRMDVSVFHTELLARLASLSSAFPAVIGRLCGRCEEWFRTCPDPVLIPKCSFLQQPGGALQHTLTAPHGGVTCMDVSAALQLLVAGSDDGVLAVWSLTDQHLLLTLPGHTAAILSVKMIESSAHCVSLAADGSLRRWSLVEGQQLFCVLEAVPVGSAPSSVHLHLSEELLFVYTSSQVKVWGPEGAELHLSSHDEVSRVLGVLGGSVVSLCYSGRVRISEPGQKTQPVETQVELRSLDPVASVPLPRRGKVLVVSEKGVLHQISRTGDHSASEFPLRPSLLLVSEDESILLSGSEWTLSLFNISSDRVEKFLDLHHDDTVLSACVSPDRRRVASGAADQLIRVWSVTTGALLDALSGANVPVTSLRFYSGLLVSASTDSASVQLWSLQYDPRHKPSARIPAGSAHVAVTRDGDWVFYVHRQNQTEVAAWNSITGSPSEHLAVSAEVSCLELAQNKRLLFCGLTSGTVLIYPLSLPQETLCIPPPESLSAVLCLAVSSQEKQVAVAYEDSVCLFEITTRDSFPTVEGPLQRFPVSLLHAPLTAMALLPDRRLLYGTRCGEVKLHDFSGGAVVDLQPHPSRVTCVTASNWGTHALVGSEDAMQRLWALNPVVLDHTMEYQGFFFEGVLSAAFSESDQFVFTGSQDRTVKVWDVVSGKLLYVQDVYSPVVRMVTNRNGFVGLSRLGSVVRETFRCPDQIRPEYNPLRNVKAQYRVTSREKDRAGQLTSGSELQDFNPAQFNLSLMLGDKPSSTCILL